MQKEVEERQEGAQYTTEFYNNQQMFSLRIAAQGSACSNKMYREIQIGCDETTAMWIFMLVVFSPTESCYIVLAGQTVSLPGHWEIPQMKAGVPTSAANRLQQTGRTEKVNVAVNG